MTNATHVALQWQAYDAIAYAFNREFAPVLRRNMATFSKNAGGDALSAARGEVEQVKGIMVQNIGAWLAPLHAWHHCILGTRYRLGTQHTPTSPHARPTINPHARIRCTHRTQLGYQ